MAVLRTLDRRFWIVSLAAAAGTLVPLLTLGLPTTATAAIILAAFQQFGLQPGPLLFVTSPDLVWGLIASLLIANVMLLVLNLPLIRLWVKLLTIPRPWLYAGILLFATLGTDLVVQRRQGQGCGAGREAIGKIGARLRGGPVEWAGCHQRMATPGLLQRIAHRLRMR